MDSKNLKQELELSIYKFNNWLSLFGCLSYDRMDYWASSAGIKAKKMIYKKNIVGVFPAIWGLLLENFFPRVQKFYGEPHREVIGDAHFAMGYLNLYKNSGNKSYLDKAEHFLEVIKSTATKGFSGLCWGYTFGWQTKYEYWEPGTPLITITPYAFWAFKKYFESTGNKESKKLALSIAEFAFRDLNEIDMPNGTISASYSPISKDVIINANTYRAATLLDAYALGGPEEYRIAAERNIDFVLSHQGKDGEWYYEAKSPETTFIDNFHTCFVLRNLYKCFLVNQDANILNAVRRGYAYYRNHLFYRNGRPKHFSKVKYPKMRKYEMYDYAEGIVLGVLLKDQIPGAYEKAIWLAKDLIRNFHTKNGYFVTRVTSLGTRHKVPYLRWPQAQLFYALTKMLLELKS